MTFSKKIPLKRGLGGFQTRLENLGRYGCYLMSLAFIARPNTSVAEISELYQKCLQKKIIGPDCYVNDPAAVLMEHAQGQRWVNHGKYTGMPPSRFCVDSDEHKPGSTAVVGVFENQARTFAHFVVIQLYSDGTVEVVFDPIESLVDPASGGSTSVQEGHCTSLRVFERTI